MTPLQEAIKEKSLFLEDLPIDEFLVDEWQDRLQSILIDEKAMFVRAVELSMSGRHKFTELKVGYGLIHMAMGIRPLTAGHARQIFNIINQIEELRCKA